MAADFEKPLALKSVPFRDPMDTGAATYQKDYYSLLYPATATAARFEKTLALNAEGNITDREIARDRYFYWWLAGRPGPAPQTPWVEEMMWPTVEEVMQLLKEIFARGKMKAAIRQTLLKKIMRGTLSGGVFLVGLGLGATSGGLGTIAGGVAGGLAGRWIGSRKFKSIPQIINRLTLREQKELYQRVLPIIQNLGCKNMAQLTNLVKCNSELQEKLLKVLRDYIINELNGEVQEG